MGLVINLGFATLFLLIALHLGFAYLAVPIALLKRSGAMWAGRRIGQAVSRGFAAMLGRLFHRRRPRIRRRHTRPPTTYFR